MKKLLFSTAVLALTAGATLAADLPSRKAEPFLPPPPPPPIWTGFYAGLNAGGTWANNNSLNLSSLSLLPDESHQIQAASMTGSIPLGSRGGFIGGAQIGYNWQPNWGGSQFVLGAEADFQGLLGASGGGARSDVGLSSQNSGQFFLNEQGIVRQSASTSLSYLGTVRGRVGYLVTPSLLIFGTGGLAYGGVNASVNNVVVDTLSTNFPRLPNGPVGYSYSSQSGSTALAGWTAGGGAEWMFAPNWSAKVEYLYYDLGTVSRTVVTSYYQTWGSADYHPDAATRYSTRFNGNIVRAGVNYHFNWSGAAPVVAKY